MTKKKEARFALVNGSLTVSGLNHCERQALFFFSLSRRRRFFVFCMARAAWKVAGVYDFDCRVCAVVCERSVELYGYV